MAMDQYLYIPFLGGWTSIDQLFWCSPGAQGFDPSPNPNFCRTPMVFLRGIHWFLPMKVPAVAYRARTSSSQFQWRTWLMPRDVKVRQSAEIGCKNEKSISKIRSWSVCCFSQKNEDEQGVSTVGVDVIIGDTFSETWWNSLWDIFFSRCSERRHYVQHYFIAEATQWNWRNRLRKWKLQANDDDV